MKFRSRSNYGHSIISPSGCRFRKTFCRDSSGKLISTGTEDIHDTVQKAAPGNVIEDLIRRATAGDPNAIRPPVDSYVDLTHVPTDIIEAHQMLIKYKDTYNALPASVKAQYGNSFDSFVNAVGTGKVSADFTAAAKKAADEQVKALSSEELTKIRSIIGGSNA